MKARRVHGVSAIFLPFDADGRPDQDAFAAHVVRTAEAGLTPAVNMDTGFGPHLSPDERLAVLRATRDALGDGPEFVAGVMPFGRDGDVVSAYRADIEDAATHGAVPIVFPSDELARAGDVVAAHEAILRGVPKALAFELSPRFAPFGRIYDADTIRRLMALERLAGLKHSSLSRGTERERLAMRDAERPGFRIYTGNDLAIDMVLWGSDYLLGLSTFDPAAFGVRDRLLAAGDDRFFDVNDALQALGSFVFRDPVPGYRTSAAIYLDLTGRIPGARPHPLSTPRPEWEREALVPLAARLSCVAD